MSNSEQKGPNRLLVAIGGNATHPENIEGTSEEQEKIAKATASALLPLMLSENELVITHGNGPVVGKILMRQALTRDRVAPMPLDICVAHSQGGIAYLLLQALENALRDANNARHVACLLTQVEVDPDDPAFDNPSKPVGAFYSEEDAKNTGRIRMGNARGLWSRMEACCSFPEATARLRYFARSGFGSERYSSYRWRWWWYSSNKRAKGVRHGVRAVIDKDLTSAHMANVLGIPTLMILTSVPQVSINFGSKHQEALHTVSLRELRKFHNEGQFPPGSMGPKIEATIRF